MYYNTILMYIKIFESDSYISNVSFGSVYSTYTYVVLIQESVFKMRTIMRAVDSLSWAVKVKRCATFFLLDLHIAICFFDL